MCSSEVFQCAEDTPPLSDDVPATPSTLRKSVSNSDDVKLERLPLKFRKFGRANFERKEKDIQSQPPIETDATLDRTITASKATDQPEPRLDHHTTPSAPPSGESNPVKTDEAGTKKGKKGKPRKGLRSTVKAEKTQGDKTEEKMQSAPSAKTLSPKVVVLDPLVSAAKPGKGKPAKKLTVPRQGEVVRLWFQKGTGTTNQPTTTTATDGNTATAAKGEAKGVMTRLRSKRTRGAVLDEDIENKAHLEEMSDDPERKLRKLRRLR